MIFLTLEHLFNHISFSIVSIVITIHLITLVVNEIVELDHSVEKGMILTFSCITGLLGIRWIYSGHFPLSDLYESLIFLSWSFYIIHMIPYFKKTEKICKCNNGARCYFYPRLCYFRLFSSNEAIHNISPRSPIPVVNDACKYDDIGLCSPFVWIVIISSPSSHYISKQYKSFW